MRMDLLRSGAVYSKLSSHAAEPEYDRLLSLREEVYYCIKGEVE